ncbi:hypothetical protein, partial [Mesorhizobium sp. M7A.F.Ca.CA.004.04.2.1]|uniref:hypothetical protein n=1 Tax=Mesorhizobium sp. M7A.F.Ca.CA.004.04.2.1 TaxID=2496677 RepID=UPI0019D4AE8A
VRPRESHRFGGGFGHSFAGTRGRADAPGPMMCIEAGGIECKKSHQKAAHRKTIPFKAGFYAVCVKSQLR